MKAPYIVAFLADRIRGNGKLSTMPHPDNWSLHYELSNIDAVRMIESASLPPPRVILADSEEQAEQLGITILETEYPKTAGWGHHRVVVASAEDDFLLYEYAKQLQQFSLLHLYMVSGIVLESFGAVLSNRLMIVGICAGNSEGEAFTRYRENYLDRAFSPEFRIGFIAKVLVVPETSIERWRRDVLQPLLASHHLDSTERSSP